MQKLSAQPTATPTAIRRMHEIFIETSFSMFTSTQMSHCITLSIVEVPTPAKPLEQPLLINSTHYHQQQ